MEEKNVKTVIRKNRVGNSFIEEVEYYDFNLYPLYLIETGYQLFLVPSDTIENACYIVRKDDSSLNRVSHGKFARELVRSEVFMMREEEEYQKSNGTTSRWKDYQIEYFDNELQYLIEKKGFILFSPPMRDSKFDMVIPRGFMPGIQMMTKQQIHNLFYLLDINPKLHLPKEMEEILLAKISTKKNR